MSRDGRLEILNGDMTKPATVILAQSAQRSEARILDSAGYPWLDIGDAPAEKVAEQLERGVQPATVDRRVRAIRVRHCQTITLVVDEQDTSPRDSLEWYGFYDEALPTLILSDRVPLTWTTLGKDLARTVSRLIDRRFRFLEALLPQLALGQRNGALDPPFDEAFAKALRCDAQTLLEHRDALRTPRRRKRWNRGSWRPMWRGCLAKCWERIAMSISRRCGACRRRIASQCATSHPVRALSSSFGVAATASPSRNPG